MAENVEVKKEYVIFRNKITGATRKVIKGVGLYHTLVKGKNWVLENTQK